MLKRVIGIHHQLGVWVCLILFYPIELLDFQAIDKTKSVQLTWQTTKEINASHFDIERSTNSKTFEKIWETKAKGASATYNFDDNTPSVI